MALQSFVAPWQLFQCLNPIHVRAPWTGNQPVTRPLPTHRTTQTHNKRAIWTHYPSVRASEDSSRLKPCSHCDRPFAIGQLYVGTIDIVWGGGWNLIGSTRHCGHQWPIVPAPGDYDDGEIGGMIGRGNRSTSEITCPSTALSTTNPTCCPDANKGRRGGKPATNRLSYGTALFWC
jgi:hypothetical protein